MTVLQVNLQQTEGIINATGKRHLLPSANASYGHICKGINKLNIDIKKDRINHDDLIISIYSTGKKVTNRDQWIDENGIHRTGKEGKAILRSTLLSI